MRLLLNYLKKVEGTHLHRLEGENDVTAPYGIYKYQHPQARIFKYIDGVAKNVGVDSSSTLWSKDEIKLIDENLDSDKIYNFAEEFYKEYLKGLHLELFPEECKITAFSLYTNSTKYCWMSIQDALIDMSKEGVVNFPTTLSKADGSYGTKTREALEYVLGLNNGLFFNLYFEKLMLLAMKTRYSKLVKSNPEKYMKFSIGWDNRMNKLAEMR